MPFAGAVLVMGASGIIAQLLLLRELLITFLSNELSIGIILANWLVLEAAGSVLVGRLVERAKERIALFVAVTLVFSASLPPALYFARICKDMAGTVPGEGMGLHQIFLATFLILLPVSLSHGALFTFACRIMTGPARRDALGIGRIYVLETLGTLAGGLAFTFFLITHLDSFETALAVSLANAAFCVVLLVRSGSAAGREVEGTGSRLAQWTLTGVSAFLAALAAWALFGPAAGKIHRLSIDAQWRDQTVIHYQNSVYGNTAVIEREGEYTFFSNGIPAITAPKPDVVFVEEFAHFPLLFHPRPEDVLIVGAGAGGVINELLKHPVKRIDYVELDPLILKLVSTFPTPLTEAELNDPRVHTHYRDGRLFLKEAPRRYDVILVGLSNPQDLQLNRFFTRQFFSLAGSKLKQGGALACMLPGSLTYLGPELRDLNACIINTMGEVFSTVRVIPGDGSNFLLASDSADLASCDAECVSERFALAGLDTRVFNPFHIRYRLDSRWSRWFAESLDGATSARNDDFKPMGVYFSLSHWNAKFAPRLQVLFALAGRVSFALVALVIGLAVIPLVFMAKGAKDSSRVSVPFAIVSTGFAGMILELALMFTFQALYGVVFYWVGLLVTAFMAGTASGSLGMTRVMGGVKRDMALFLKIEAALVLFSAALPLVFLGLEPYLDRPGLAGVIKIMFTAVSFFAGLLIGMEFPLAGKIRLGSGADVGGTSGLLYGADLLGGWAGGIVGGVVLLPLLGLVETCLVLVVLKVVSLTVVAAGATRVKSPAA